MSDKIENDAPEEETDQRRRELLQLMKSAAIAGPVLMTLKNTPALAENEFGSVDASATNTSHFQQHHAN